MRPLIFSLFFLLSLFLRAQELKYDQVDSIVMLSRQLSFKGIISKDSAVLFLKDHLKRAIDPHSKLRFLYRIGIFKKVLGQYDSAIFYYQESEKLLTEVQAENTWPFWFEYRKGEVQRQMGLYPESLESLEKAKDLITQDGEWLWLHMDLGFLHNLLKDYKTSVKYFDLCYKKALERNQLHRCGTCAAQKGESLYEMGELDSALIWINKGQEYKMSLVRRVRSNTIKSQIYLKQNKPQEAVLNFKKVVHSYDSISKEQTLVVFWATAGKLLTTPYAYLIKDDLKMSYEDAFEKAEEAIQSSTNSILVIEFKEYLAEAYKEVGQYDKAYQSLKEASLLKVEKYDKERLVTFKADKERAAIKSEKEIKEQQDEIAEQRKILYLITLVAIVVLAFLVMVFVNQRKQKRLNQLLSQQNEDILSKNSKIETQTRELGKMDELKSRFFVNISHEIRTPLTLILGSVNHALEGGYGKVNERLNGALKTSARNSNRLLRMVNDILDLSKLESGKLRLFVEEVKVDSLVSRTIDTFRSQAANRKILIQENIDTDLPLVFIDREKIETVLINLLGNALKFTKDEDRITITVELHQNSLRIMVNDSGEGIAAEDLPHIFDRFYQREYDNQSGGSGVGLALSKELIDRHKGTIMVESTENEGSTFTINLPLGIEHFETEDFVTVSESQGEEDLEIEIFSDATGLPNNESALSSKNHYGSYSILIVEDNDDMRNYIRDLLEAEYNLHFATDGQEALQFLSKQQPDLILTDYMMPVMNGLEMLKQIKLDKNLQNIPVIFITARAGDEDRLEVLQHGIDDYIIKPFVAQELTVRIDNLLHLQRERSLMGSSDMEAVNVSDSFSGEVFKIIAEQLKNADLTLDMLASELSVSKRTMFRKIKSSTGFSPEQYIKEIRLLEARKLLEKNEKQSISEIAFAVGFENLSHFSTSYKKRFGKSPSDYLA